MGLSVSCIVLRRYPTFFASPALSSGFLRLEGPKHLPINSSARSWLRHCTLSPFPSQGQTHKHWRPNVRTAAPFVFKEIHTRLWVWLNLRLWKQLVAFPLWSDRAVSLFSVSYCVTRQYLLLLLLFLNICFLFARFTTSGKMGIWTLLSMRKL